jgi:DNA-binding response OmpR family regulator
MRILLIEDESKIAEFVCAGLAQRGFEAEHRADGDRGLEAAAAGGYDAIVLDIMLPGRDGLSVLGELRGSGDRTPVILLTARNDLEDRVQGLTLGADDYLAKPFFVEELAARLQALLRRTGGTDANVLVVGELRLNRITRVASWNRTVVELTNREFALLEYLMRSPGRVCTRTQILEHVWGYDFDPTTNVVDVCIQRIRRKIAPGPEADNPIESVRGVGYRCRIPAAEAA